MSAKLPQFSWGKFHRMGTNPSEAVENLLQMPEVAIRASMIAKKPRYWADQDFISSVKIAILTDDITDEVITCAMVAAVGPDQRQQTKAKQAMEHAFNESTRIDEDSPVTRKVTPPWEMANKSCSDSAKSKIPNKILDDRSQMYDDDFPTQTLSSKISQWDDESLASNHNSWGSFAQKRAGHMTQAAHNHDEAIDQLNKLPLPQAMKMYMVSNGGLPTVGIKFMTMMEQLGILSLDDKSSQDALILKFEKASNPIKSFITNLSHLIDECDHQTNLQKVTAICFRWLDSMVGGVHKEDDLRAIVPGSIALQAYSGITPEATSIAEISDLRDFIWYQNAFAALGCKKQAFEAKGKQGIKGILGIYNKVDKDKMDKGDHDPLVMATEVTTLDPSDGPLSTKTKQRLVKGTDITYSPHVIRWCFIATYQLASTKFSSTKLETAEVLESEQNAKKSNMEQHLHREGNLLKLIR